MLCLFCWYDLLCVCSVCKLNKSFLLAVSFYSVTHFKYCAIMRCDLPITTCLHLLLIIGERNNILSKIIKTEKQKLSTEQISCIHKLMKAEEPNIASIYSKFRCYRKYLFRRHFMLNSCQYISVVLPNLTARNQYSKHGWNTKRVGELLRHHLLLSIFKIKENFLWLRCIFIHTV